MRGEWLCNYTNAMSHSVYVFLNRLYKSFTTFFWISYRNLVKVYEVYQTK